MASHRSPTPPWQWRRRTHVAAVLVSVLAVTGVVLHGGDAPTAVVDDPAPAPARALVPVDDVAAVTAPASPRGEVAADVPTRPARPDKPAPGSDLAARVEALVDSGKVPQKRRAVRQRKQQEEPLQLATPTPGRSGTGMSLGALGSAVAPVGGPVTGTVTTSVANVPNRTSPQGFVESLRLITAEEQDFVMLNEVSGRDLAAMRAVAPAYDAYRDPVQDRSRGGTQSMNNVVLWRADRWNLVDAGRVKVVDDDRGYAQGRAFVWDRYLTWAVLQRKTDGAVVSVLSTHMPTNPARYPAQPGGGRPTRLERYSRGMDVVVATVRTLSRYGPVLLGGDMNSHPQQGAWTAAQKMRAAGHSYVKDRAVMYLFHPPGTQVLAHREVRIRSDHPAIVTTLDMGGQGPTT